MHQKPLKGIAVDCGCKGNPGKADYRGVDIETGKTLFYVKIPGLSTNNIAEYLAAVHGLRYAKKRGLQVYSDSTIAIGWVKRKNCFTKFTIDNDQQKSLIKLAQLFLRRNNLRVNFWNNKAFGEIPADLSNNKGIKFNYKDFVK
jgi:ribonuclease HI